MKRDGGVVKVRLGLNGLGRVGLRLSDVAREGLGLSCVDGLIKVCEGDWISEVCVFK